MTEKLIPLPQFHEEWIKLLFHVANTMVLTEQQYRIYWPLVDGFWSHTQSQKHQHGKFVTHYYVCRVSKTRASSTAEKYPVENISGKTRVTAFHTPGNCLMKIKIQESLDDTKPKVFTVMQVVGKTGEKTHDHTVDASWKRKRSSFLTGIIKDELAKGYTPGQVKDRLKGTGRAGGYERLEKVGGAFMKR